jgi:uncharacterized lipoprotein YmbA
MKNLSALVPLGAVALLTACNVLPQPQADTVRHFTLSAPADLAPLANGTIVRPVHLAGHLRNRAMAVRVADNEVVYLDEIRWAEPLDDAITQLLRARLGAVAGGATVSVQIERCELVRSAGNQVQLGASYTIVPADGGKEQAVRGTFAAGPRAWEGKDYRQLVGQIREAIGELGDSIAAALVKKS